VLLVFDDEDAFARHRVHVRARRWLNPLLRFGGGFDAGLFVQERGKFLKTGNDLGRFGQNCAREFLSIIGPALRHFRERHHHRKRVVNAMFDLAEFLLQLDQFFVGDGAVWVAHKSGFSLEKTRGCA